MLLLLSLARPADPFFSRISQLRRRRRRKALSFFFSLALLRGPIYLSKVNACSYIVPTYIWLKVFFFCFSGKSLLSFFLSFFLFFVSVFCLDPQATYLPLARPPSSACFKKVGKKLDGKKRRIKKKNFVALPEAPSSSQGIHRTDRHRRQCVLKSKTDILLFGHG